MSRDAPTRSAISCCESRSVNVPKPGPASPPGVRLPISVVTRPYEINANIEMIRGQTSSTGLQVASREIDRNREQLAERG